MLWQIVAHCRRRSCSCREIEIRAALVGDDLDAFSEEDGELFVWFCKATRGGLPAFLGRVGILLRDTPPEPTPRARVHARVEFQRGRAELSPSASAHERDEELLQRVREELDGEVLDALYDEFRRAQGYDVRTEPQKDGWSAWRSGKTVSWSEAYPDARQDQYDMQDELVCAHDLYCVRPACSCNTMWVSFRSDHQIQTKAIGQAKVYLNSGKLVKLEPGAGSPSTVRDLWDRFQRRHRIPDVLQRRSAHLVEHLGPHLYGTTYQPKVHPSQAPIGRNAPCPCGSGQKFKKCCGSPKQ